MAFYVNIRKISEDENFAYYEYCGLHNGKFGQLKIIKSSGDVHTLKSAEGDEFGSHAKRASWALIKHWVKGEYPDKTFWAS
jgi:hypothetical protein